MSWPVILTDNSVFMLKITRLLEWDFNKSQNTGKSLDNSGKHEQSHQSIIVTNGRKICNINCSNLTFN